MMWVSDSQLQTAFGPFTEVQENLLTSCCLGDKQTNPLIR
jgi:hypothetical protein